MNKTAKVGYWFYAAAFITGVLIHLAVSTVKFVKKK